MSDGSVDRYLLGEEREVALEWGVPHRGPPWAETVGKRAGRLRNAFSPNAVPLWGNDCSSLGLHSPGRIGLITAPPPPGAEVGPQP